jgi:hypothetical protein
MRLLMSRSLFDDIASRCKPSRDACIQAWAGGRKVERADFSTTDRGQACSKLADRVGVVQKSAIMVAHVLINIRKRGHIRTEFTFALSTLVKNEGLSKEGIAQVSRYSCIM